MPQSESIAPNLGNLPEHLEALPAKIQSLNLTDFFTSALARRDLTNRIIERSFNTSSGLTELAIVIVLMMATLYLSNFLWRRYVNYLSAKSLANGSESRGNFWIHLIMRVSWPLLMIFASIIGVYVWRLTGNRPVWFHLLGIAASWLIIIRLCTAILRFSLPKKVFTSYIERLVSTLIWVFFFLWITDIDRLVIKRLQNIILPIGKVKITLYTILQGLFWLSIVMVLALWVANLIESRLMKATRLDTSLKIVSAKFIKTTLILAALLFTLPAIGIDLTLFSVFWGALGVGLGFGLQKVASNYISGFIILLDRSIRLGDRLVVNNFTGYVTQLTSRFVVLKDSSGAEALVPNENFISQQIINESYTAKSLLRIINLQVSYQSNIPQALEILLEAAQQQERIEQLPAPSAYITNFDDNGINISLSFWVKDPENGFAVLTSNILLDIWQAFKEAGIEFPYPQREVRLINNSEQPSTHTIQIQKNHHDQHGI